MSASATWSDDAGLTDVCFIDSMRGWAVGDRGTILRTIDGGANWSRVASPVNCSLEGVFFLNDRDGWAYGGFARPLTNLSAGVVLRTFDGGQTWRRLATGVVPWITQMQMDDVHQGWALVVKSPMFPTGLMLTQDGGQSWRSYRGDAPGQPIRGARLGRNRFTMIGTGRQAMLVREAQAEVEPAYVLSKSATQMSDLAMVNQQYGWSVGGEGTILFTNNEGFSWDLPPNPLPAERFQHFDWRSVAISGDGIWIVGDPGTVVARSLDQGRQWELIPTGGHLPLNRIRMLDSQHGWAVGEMGTILRTEDGGTSWQQVRNSAPRVAILGMFEDQTTIPVELFARYSGNDGYYSAVHFDSPFGDRDESLWRNRQLRAVVSNLGVGGLSHAAMRPLETEPRSTGGASADPALIGQVELESSDRAEVIDHEARFRKRVRAIRTWRPEVVVIDALESDLESANETIRHYLSAIHAAADRAANHEQLDATQLEPWQVTKVYVRRSTPLESADESLPVSQFAPFLATAIDDYCLLGKCQLQTVRPLHRAKLEWQQVECAIANGAAYRALLTGIPSPTLSRLRRERPAHTNGNLETMRRQAAKWDEIQEIIVATQATPRTVEVSDSLSPSPQAIEDWSQRVDGLLIGLGAMGSGNALMQLAWEHENAGQYEFACRAMLRLRAEFPDHPLTEGAIVWLIRYFASTEARWVINRASSFPHIAVVGHEEPIFENPEGRRSFDYDSPIGTADDDPIRVPFSLQQMVSDRLNTTVPADQRGYMVRELLSDASSYFPLVDSLPPVLLSYSASERSLGSLQETRTQVISAARRAGHPWALLGEAEHWLRNPDSAPPVPVAICRPAQAPPYLDGELQDLIWLNAPPIDLRLLSPREAQPDEPTIVRFARDAEFLFLAIEARTQRSNLASVSQGEADPQPRQRDVVLTDSDRIHLRLDVDRDYATGYVFEIDERGWIRDSFLGNNDWDPQWFVETKRTPTGWTMEIAIPFSQLGVPSPADRAAWNISLRRLSPGTISPKGTQTLTAAPTLESLMIFQD